LFDSRYIGLTGGIASGKSSVSHFFSELDIPIIDADYIAKKITEPKQVGYQAIQTHFGDDFFNFDGMLDRPKLKKAIFSDPKKRQLLESLLHPLINKEMFQQAQKLKQSPYILFDIPLLIENIKKYSFQHIIVVDIKPEEQKKRLLLRDNMNQKIANQIIQTQVPQTQRLKYATCLIDNNGSLEKLSQQVFNLHQQLLDDFSNSHRH